MEEMKRLTFWTLFGLLTMIIIALASCTTTRYVPVESVRTEIQYKDRLQRDSIHVLDSVFMFIKGDTVFRDRYRTVYKDKLTRDTVYLCKVDSIRIPLPVEKSLTRWQAIKMDFGGIAIGGAAIIIASFLIWIVLGGRGYFPFFKSKSTYTGK